MRTVAPGAIAHAAAQGEDRIEHGADRVGERPAVDHRDRRSDAVAAAEEAGPVGLHLRLPHGLAIDDGEMRGPDFRLARRAPPPRRQDGARRRRDTRSRRTASKKAGCATSAAWRRQHELGIGGDVDLARAVAGIGDRDAADLGIVLGRDEHLQRRRERSVAPGELGAILVEGDIVGVGLGAARLEAGRPDVAAADVAQEDVGAPVVAGGVLAPARHGQAAPAAVTGAGGRQHHRVAAVGQQMGGGRRGVRGGRAAGRRAVRSPAPWRPTSRPPPRGAPRRRRAACAPAAAARSPGPSARRGTARASRRPAARRRWPRSSCPDDAP